MSSSSRDGWQDAPYFTDAERAALALTETVTPAQRPGGSGTRRWDEAARHYDEPALAALVLIDRPDQRLEPAQRHCQAADRRVGAVTDSVA